MSRLIPLLAAIALVASACGQKPADDAAPMKVGALLSTPEKFVGKKITLTGTVTHVCKHGGKRCHLTDTDADQKIRVETGDKVKAFDRAIEGSDLTVTGILRETRIDEAYLASWESEILAAEKEEAAKPKEKPAEGAPAAKAGEEHAEGEEGANMPNGGHVEAQGLEAVNELRAELKASGKPYLSQWWIEAVSYSVAADQDAKN
jgi:hypothetical protein